jgi:hypothetical protein
MSIIHEVIWKSITVHGKFGVTFKRHQQDVLFLGESNVPTTEPVFIR